VERVAALEPVLADAMAPLARHPLVSEVRTCGLLAGVELNAEVLQRMPGLTDTIVREARARGVLTRALMGTTLQVSPPFVIEESQLRTTGETFLMTLDAVQALVPA
jgi:putrescine---pyruvate transaminase